MAEGDLCLEQPDRALVAHVRTYVRDFGGHPGGRFQRALAAGNLTAAEEAAFEAFVPLADARALVELYAEKGDRKYERAALQYLGGTWTRRTRRWPMSPRSPPCSPSAAC